MIQKSSDEKGLSRTQRMGHKNKAMVLRPDQIVKPHEYTSVDPFNLRTDQRCSEQKGRVYKRNEEEY